GWVERSEPIGGVPRGTADDGYPFRSTHPTTAAKSCDGAKQARHRTDFFTPVRASCDSRWRRNTAHIRALAFSRHVEMHMQRESMPQAGAAAVARTASLSVPEKIPVALTINGVDTQLRVAPWTTLLDALRDHLDLTGAKKGCDHGQCGACTVLVNGRRI